MKVARVQDGNRGMIRESSAGREKEVEGCIGRIIHSSSELTCTGCPASIHLAADASTMSLTDALVESSRTWNDIGRRVVSESGGGE